jgi:hypothetical protein
MRSRKRIIWWESGPTGYGASSQIRVPQYEEWMREQEPGAGQYEPYELVPETRGTEGDRVGVLSIRFDGMPRWHTANTTQRS